MNGIELFATYKADLCNYSPAQLHYISKEGVWSIAQMYDHILLVAHEYLDHVETCAASTEEKASGKTPAGEQLVRIGGFPPIKIRLPDEMNAPPDNSQGKQELERRIDEVIERLKRWESEVDSINPRYKVRHGGLAG